MSSWSRFGSYLALGFAITMIAGGIALFANAAHTMPAEPHHGSAVDGLDGLGTFFALVQAGFALMLWVGAALLVRLTFRRPARPLPPPPIELPRARARNVRPQ